MSTVIMDVTTKARITVDQKGMPKRVVINGYDITNWIAVDGLNIDYTHGTPLLHLKLVANEISYDTI